ncbi:MAG: fibronectin type III domain-containing protein [Flavobacteriaceae bacterium]
MLVGVNPLFLEGGVPLVLTNTELAAYFRFENIKGISLNTYEQSIPEGTYQFCYEVYDVLTGNRLSQKSCVIGVIFHNEPPFLISPKDKSLVSENNPQNIIFQWTPRNINVGNVEYELSLVEIWDNQIDPQAAFLSSVPVFKTTTMATYYMYGPADPLLLQDKNYAWRVQAKAKNGGEEIGSFKNQGNSEIFSFSYARSCDLSLGIISEVKGSTNANIFWNDLSNDVPEYSLRYRKKGNSNQWFTSKTSTNQLTLWNLKAGTKYEYQLQKNCKVTQSIWSSPKEFTTFIIDNEASIYQCGISPNFSITNNEPLPKLSAGDSFVAGDFPINVIEINGSKGRFTGRGYVTIPYLNNIKVGVEFTNVLINTDKQLSQGTVVTVFDPNLVSILDVDEVVETVDNTVDLVTEPFEGDNDLDEIRINWALDHQKDIKVVDGIMIITNPENGATVSEPLGDDKVIIDSGNKVYHIDAGGIVTEGGEIDAAGAITLGIVDGIVGNGQLERLTAKDIKITFKGVSGTYGFDEIPTTANANIKKQYTIIKDADDNDYILAHQAIENGSTAYIDAIIEQTGSNHYVLDSIVFKTKQGERIPVEIRDKNTIRLTLKGRYTFENEIIYAVVPSKTDKAKQHTAGAFTLWHMADRSADLVLVSVNGGNVKGLATEIAKIFKKGAVTINIETQTANADLDPAILGDNGLLDIGESGWLTNYNSEQKAVISDLKNKIDYNTNKYYVFVFGGNILPTKPIGGFMPLQRQFGFVFTSGNNPMAYEEGKGELAKTIAHEIGHGIFALQHPYDQYGSEKESTNWLMDNGVGSQLNHMDWKQLHNPELKFYVFQKEEEGEISSAEIAFKALDLVEIGNISDKTDNIVYVSPAGIPISLPKEAIPAFYKVKTNPITAYGVLASFTIPNGSGKGIYLGHNRGSEFTGYKITKEDDPYQFLDLPDKNNIKVRSIDSGLGCSHLLLEGKFVPTEINKTGTGTLITKWNYNGPADLVRIQDQNYDTCLHEIEYSAFTDYIIGYYNYYGKGGFLRMLNTTDGNLVYLYTIANGENGQVHAYQYNRVDGLWKLTKEPSYNVNTAEDLQYLFGTLYSSEAGHLLLDTAGMAPAIGELFDAINGAWYTWEGDGQNAAISFASTIPFMYTTSVKNIGKVIKLADGNLSVVKFPEKAIKELGEIIKKLGFDTASFKALEVDMADETFAKMIIDNPKLIESWKILEQYPVLRKKLPNLENINKWINEGIEFQKLADGIAKSRNKQNLIDVLGTAKNKLQVNVLIKDYNNIPGVTKGRFISNSVTNINSELIRHIDGKEIKMYENQSKTFAKNATLLNKNSIEVIEDLGNGIQFIKIKPDTKLYRVFDGYKPWDEITRIGNTLPNGSYWTFKRPNVISDVIEGIAVMPEWNGMSKIIEIEVPSNGLYGWFGKAAKQPASSSASEYFLKGGEEQIIISFKQNQQNISSITSSITNAPWTK